ncbi:hypothetical protein V6N13_051553 [Hibiscus sabdariffa]|uniref:Uncharacterized protein n=1 Tax=Hibiscus sabdariffa TaxID=183260 RepID=A0ABR2T479_9ROSI
MQEIQGDTPSCVIKAAPDFCTVYVINKAKISSIRDTSRSAPFASPLLDQINKQNSALLDNQIPTATINPAPKVVVARYKAEPDQRLWGGWVVGEGSAGEGGGWLVRDLGF